MREYRRLSPHRKKDYLLKRNLNRKREGFIDRNLNDTRYMFVAIKNRIEETLDFPQDGHRHVFAVVGGATAALRRARELNYGSDGTKGRSDDRNHVVDATVIAVCSAGAVKRIALAHSRKHLIPKEQWAALFQKTEPWPGFADTVRACREKIVPTRMANHGVTGQAFEETLYHFDAERSNGKAEFWLGKGAKASGNYMVDDEGNARIVGGYL